MEQQVTVVIIEDHPVVTEGVASWIRSDPGQRVRLVQTGRDLTGLRVVPRLSADVVILDLELSGELVHYTLNPGQTLMVHPGHIGKCDLHIGLRHQLGFRAADR